MSLGGTTEGMNMVIPDMIVWNKIHSIHVIGSAILAILTRGEKLVIQGIPIIAKCKKICTSKHLFRALNVEIGSCVGLFPY
jgi:hypothetical protein